MALYKFRIIIIIIIIIKSITLCPELAKRSCLRYVGVQIQEIVEILDGVAKATDAEVLVSERSQVKHLPFATWYKYTIENYVCICSGCVTMLYISSK